MTIISIFSFIILILSIIIHEISHGYAALALGDSTAKYAGRLTLNPLKHIDPMGSIIVPIITSFAGLTFGWAKPVPFNPYNLRNKRWGEAIVAIAGPASNILIFLVFGLSLRLIPNISPTLTSLLAIITLINISLTVFNLIPVPPLDGSKIIFALIPPRYITIRQWLEKYQWLFILLLVFILWQYISPLIYYLFTLVSGVSL
jgi:Zn-dependent protease